jgi:hypothetical protein
MSEPQSSLARHVASGPKTDAEVRADCCAAYHRDGVICIREDWLTSWPDRTQLRLLADKVFGKRRGN